MTLQQGRPVNATPARELTPITGPQHLFLGAPTSPLLAPRGVCLAKGRLIVADTGQNRVFVWSNYSDILTKQLTHMEPEVVLGQVDDVATGRNAGAEANASSLHYPSGIWSDGERLVIADAWNHRVLIWNQFPTRSGQAADVVLGQPNFHSTVPNGAIGGAPSARSLNWPYGVTSDGKRLWIADTGNRRILLFNQWPNENAATADVVVGKSTFTERDYEHEDPIWPYSVKIGPKGEMIVADTQYYRCMLWKDWRLATHQRADYLIGQKDFTDNGMNQFDLFPRADTLSWCYDACFYSNGLLVADTGNSRVLWFSQVPGGSGVCADNLLGKPHFRVGSENSATVFGTEAQLYWPFSISTENDVLALADTGNHRITLQKMMDG
ncbi:MAG: hypothetical protein AAFQ37_03870 [Bacteroidota bacterium]